MVQANSTVSISHLNYLIMRLGRHGGTRFSVPVSKKVDHMKYPPGSRTCDRRSSETKERALRTARREKNWIASPAVVLIDFPRKF